MKSFKILFILTFLALFIMSCQTKEVNEVVFKSHNLDLQLNVDNHEASFKDEGLMQVFQGVNVLYLAPNAQISTFTIDESAPNLKLMDSSAVNGLDSDLAIKIAALDPPDDALWVLFKQKTPGK